MSDCLRLKKSNCKNCYKCIRHCPVKAIRFSGNQANIIGNECILCGQCFVVCPQNAKEITSETEKVRVMIQSGAPVIASLAPSFAANYDGVGIDNMRAALKKLGFADAEETAVGATIVKNEYQRMLREEHRDVLISSCCHSVNLLIQKYFPQALPCLADTLSPMQAHCRDIKARHPDAETVFIGPCVAKKDEADYYGGYTDAVLTFEELTEWMRAENVVPEKGTDNSINSRERLFPTSGGILDTMNERLPEYTYIEVDGVANCIDALHDITDGKVHRCFIEMSACEGSCIGGPVMEKYHRSPIVNHTSIKRYAGKNDFIVTQPDAGALKKVIEPIEKRLPMPTDDELRDVLKQMGKTKPDGRAELRLLRLQHLPRKGCRRVPGQGGDLHVPAVSEGKGGILLRQYRQQFAERNHRPERQAGGSEDQSGGNEDNEHTSVLRRSRRTGCEDSRPEALP